MSINGRIVSDRSYNMEEVKISFPFIWKSRGQDIYVRYKSGCDICLVGHLAGQTFDRSGTGDQSAWYQRLPRNSALMLFNEV